MYTWLLIVPASVFGFEHTVGIFGAFVIEMHAYCIDILP